MKTLLVAIGITAGFVASLSAQVHTGPSGRRSDAGPYQAGSNAGPDQFIKRKVVMQKPKQESCTYYYTNYTAPGSMIPVVIRRYKGVDWLVGANQGYDVFTASDFGATGVVDLSSGLRRLEPDIFSSANPTLGTR